MEAAKEIVERLDILKGQRKNHDTLWQECADLIHPTGGDYITKHSPGERKTERMVDMTGARSLERFVAAMMTFHTPRNQQWAKLRASEESLNKSPAVKEFFEAADRELTKQRYAPTARFDGQTYEVWKSEGLTGNGCLYVDEGPTGGFRYRFTHVGQTWVETDWQGVVDTVYYEYELTSRAAVQKWGEDAPDMAKKNVSSNQPLEKVKLVHCVRPNKQRERGNPGPEGKAFESLEISVDDHQIVDRGGFEEMPYLWTRYMVNPSETYGRGPAGLALPDIQTLNEMQKTFLRAGHKVVDPPLLAASDKQLGRGSKKIRLGPGKVTWGGLDHEGRDMIKPLVTGARLDITEAMQDTLRENVEDVFLVKFWDMLLSEKRQMTATEVIERAKEKGQMLAPVISRQQSEFLGPLVTREIGMAQRQGLLPPLPPELVEADGEYTIEYESDATRMQRADEVSAFTRWQEVMIPVTAQDPGYFGRVLDLDEVGEHYGHDLGVPSKLFRSEEEREAMAAQEAQAAEAAQMAAEMPGVAKGLRDVSEIQAA